MPLHFIYCDERLWTQNSKWFKKNFELIFLKWLWNVYIYKRNKTLPLPPFRPKGLFSFSFPCWSSWPISPPPSFSLRAKPCALYPRPSHRPARPGSPAHRFPLPPLANELAPHRESLPGGTYASATWAFLLARDGSEQDSTPNSKNPDTPGISYPCTHRTAINP